MCITWRVNCAVAESSSYACLTRPMRLFQTVPSVVSMPARLCMGGCDSATGLVTVACHARCTSAIQDVVGRYRLARPKTPSHFARAGSVRPCARPWGRIPWPFRLAVVLSNKANTTPLPNRVNAPAQRSCFEYSYQNFVLVCPQMSDLSDARSQRRIFLRTMFVQVRSLEIFSRSFTRLKSPDSCE